MHVKQVQHHAVRPHIAAGFLTVGLLLACTCFPLHLLLLFCGFSETPPSERIALSLRALLPHLIISFTVDLSLCVCAHSYLCLTLIFSFIFHAFMCANTHTDAHTNSQSNSMDLLSALWPSRLKIKWPWEPCTSVQP